MWWVKLVPMPEPSRPDEVTWGSADEMLLEADAAGGAIGAGAALKPAERRKGFILCSKNQCQAHTRGTFKMISQKLEPILAQIRIENVWALMLSSSVRCFALRQAGDHFRKEVHTHACRAAQGAAE